MKNDLISRSALLEFAKNRYNQTVIPADIKDFPAVDAVEVVRCKDCVYWPKAKVNRKGFLICPASGMEITAKDFCSYGERRTDDAD